MGSVSQEVEPISEDNPGAVNQETLGDFDYGGLGLNLLGDQVNRSANGNDTDGPETVNQTGARSRGCGTAGAPNRIGSLEEAVGNPGMSGTKKPPPRGKNDNERVVYMKLREEVNTIIHRFGTWIGAFKMKMETPNTREGEKLSHWASETSRKTAEAMEKLDGLAPQLNRMDGFNNKQFCQLIWPVNGSAVQLKDSVKSMENCGEQISFIKGAFDSYEKNVNALLDFLTNFQSRMPSNWIFDDSMDTDSDFNQLSSPTSSPDPNGFDPEVVEVEPEDITEPDLPSSDQTESTATKRIVQKQQQTVNFQDPSSSHKNQRRLSSFEQLATDSQRNDLSSPFNFDQNGAEVLLCPRQSEERASSAHVADGYVLESEIVLGNKTISLQTANAVLPAKRRADWTLERISGAYFAKMPRMNGIHHSLQHETKSDEMTEEDFMYRNKNGTGPSTSDIKYSFQRGLISYQKYYQTKRQSTFNSNPSGIPTPISSPHATPSCTHSPRSEELTYLEGIEVAFEEVVTQENTASDEMMELAGSHTESPVAFETGQQSAEVMFSPRAVPLPNASSASVPNGLDIQSKDVNGPVNRKNYEPPKRENAKKRKMALCLLKSEHPDYYVKSCLLGGEWFLDEPTHSAVEKNILRVSGLQAEVIPTNEVSDMSILETHKDLRVQNLEAFFNFIYNEPWRNIQEKGRGNTANDKLWKLKHSMVLQLASQMSKNPLEMTGKQICDWPVRSVNRYTSCVFQLPQQQETSERAILIQSLKKPDQMNQFPCLRARDMQPEDLDLLLGTTHWIIRDCQNGFGMDFSNINVDEIKRRSTDPAGDLIMCMEQKPLPLDRDTVQPNCGKVMTKNVSLEQFATYYGRLYNSSKKGFLEMEKASSSYGEVEETSSSYEKVKQEILQEKLKIADGQQEAQPRLYAMVDYSLEDDKQFEDVKMIVEKLPERMRPRNKLDMLGEHVNADINGVKVSVNLPCTRFYCQMDKNGLATAMLNVGPGPMLWWMAPFEFPEMKRENKIYLNGVWPNLKTLDEKGIIYVAVIQKPGDLVFANGGVLFWGQSQGFTTILSWKLAPETPIQLQTMARVHDLHAWDFRDKELLFPRILIDMAQKERFPGNLKMRKAVKLQLARLLAYEASCIAIKKNREYHKLNLPHITNTEERKLEMIKTLYDKLMLLPTATAPQALGTSTSSAPDHIHQFT